MTKNIFLSRKWLMAGAMLFLSAACQPKATEPNQQRADTYAAPAQTPECKEVSKPPAECPKKECPCPQECTKECPKKECPKECPKPECPKKECPCPAVCPKKECPCPKECTKDSCELEMKGLAEPAAPAAVQSPVHIEPAVEAPITSSSDAAVEKAAS